MKLVVLGSGTSVPHARRASPAFWLQTNTGAVLLDISSDTLHRMAQEGLDWANLQAIWVSHFHLDHLGGLAPFLFAMKWAPQTQERRQQLSIYGPSGLTKLLKAIDESYEYRLLDQHFPINIVEVGAGAQLEILPGLGAETFSTLHTKESLAIRLRDLRNSTLVYTSDTGYSEHLIDFAKDVTVLLMECSFHSNKPLNTHLELFEAIKLARACAPQKLVLTHLYPEWDDFDLRKEARELWSGETIEAVDGLAVEF
jgi:ribonuclease BN (tRNA processing enzyme)